MKPTEIGIPTLPEVSPDKPTPRILVPVGDLGHDELLRISDELAADFAAVERELVNLRGRLQIHDEGLRKDTIRIMVYGILGLGGLIAADATIDLFVLLPLVGIVMMVWEALKFAGEMSRYHGLEDVRDNLLWRVSLIDRELSIIAEELKRRACPP